MKNTSVYLVFALVLIGGLFGEVAIAGTDNTMIIQKALESGHIKMTLEGKEDGNMLNIKVEKITSAPIIVIIPKGDTDFKIGSQPATTITINTSREVQIDLSKINAGEKKVPQSGKIRIIDGSVDLMKSAGGMTYGYHNFQVGVK